MVTADFGKSVFINCPFDEKYEPILQAILFTVVYLGFRPKLSSERIDSAENRLEKIISLIESSRFSIHDLSRGKAKKKGEYFRLNMPFELGIDYAYRRHLGDGENQKKILILEQKKYQYLAALSDIAGCDIQSHNADFEKAVRKVRNWLVTEAEAPSHGAGLLIGKYFSFQGWNYDKQIDAGFSEEDIKDYPTKELLEAMNIWMSAGEPDDFSSES